MRSKKMMKSRESLHGVGLTKETKQGDVRRSIKQRRGLTEEKAAVREESDWLISNHYDCDD